MTFTFDTPTLSIGACPLGALLEETPWERFTLPPLPHGASPWQSRCCVRVYPTAPPEPPRDDASRTSVLVLKATTFDRDALLAAFEYRFEEIASRLRGLLLRRADIEDILQDVWIQVQRSHAKGLFSDWESFNRQLWTITYNAHVNRFRRTQGKGYERLTGKIRDALRELGMDGNKDRANEAILAELRSKIHGQEDDLEGRRLGEEDLEILRETLEDMAPKARILFEKMHLDPETKGIKVKNPTLMAVVEDLRGTENSVSYSHAKKLLDQAEKKVEKAFGRELKDTQKRPRRGKK